MDTPPPSRSWVAEADLRSSATFLDCLFAFICLLPMEVAVSLSASAGFPWWAVLAIGLIGWITLTMLVFSAFESSRLRGTPGKLAVGLAVISKDGSRVSFSKALKRNFIKYSMNVYGTVSLIKGGWAPDAAFHDSASDTVVVRAAKRMLP